jgi:hypothetical protein
MRVGFNNVDRAVTELFFNKAAAHKKNEAEEGSPGT